MFLVLSVLVVVAAIAHLGAVAALIVPSSERQSLRPVIAVMMAASLGAALAERLLAPELGALTWAGAATVAVTCASYAALQRNLTPSGALVWSTWCALTAFSAAWALLFLLSLQISPLTASLLWATALLTALTLPSTIIQAREGWEALFRRSWARPRLPLQDLPDAYPRISIHVPTHAEPPSVVISTLDALAELDYPNFEVLVVDNNTADPALWEPIQEHCLRLGARFRFLHVEEITGAKAGALNWAAPYTDPRAELIGVVDADYHVSPDWLKKTVGHFAGHRVGFVQAPHAYRNHPGSRFRSWANWEYAVFFTTGMVALNEHNAGLTVGTMSLIRRSALEEAGGWAEWCLTEDSELAIRIHALGYDGVYLSEPCGWGLIPDTFAAYRKQRFRWTFGPVQEMRKHWRMFLPARLGGAQTELTWRQRIHHGNHGLDVACIGLRALVLPLGALTALSMALQHETVSMPFSLFIAAAAVLISSIAMRLLVYRRSVGATLAQALGGTIAFAALNHVIIVASLKALFGRPAVWERTNKFPATRQRLGALQDTLAECIIAAAGITASASLLLLGSGGLITMFALGLGAQSLVYLTSPTLALIADRELTRKVSPDSEKELILTGVR